MLPLNIFAIRRRVLYFFALQDNQEPSYPLHQHEKHQLQQPTISVLLPIVLVQY